MSSSPHAAPCSLQSSPATTPSAQRTLVGGLDISEIPDDVEPLPRANQQVYRYVGVSRKQGRKTNPWYVIAQVEAFVLTT